MRVRVNLAPADYVYLKGNFTGSLTGSQNGKQYAIYNLVSLYLKTSRVALPFQISTLKM